MKFTESQLQAIAHNQGNLQIIACAGSGKTEVVARRVATLLKNGTANGLQPRNIVAFTFTEKAAAELKERIVTRCREELGEVYGLAEMFVGTIHAFCLELLKSEAPKNLNFTGVPLRRYRDPGHDLTELSIFREDDLDKENLSAC